MRQGRDKPCYCVRVVLRPEGIRLDLSEETPIIRKSPEKKKSIFGASLNEHVISIGVS